MSRINVTFEKIYPVGSIYISVNPTNPKTLFGIGKWEMLAQGHTLWSITSGVGGGR